MTILTRKKTYRFGSRIISKQEMGRLISSTLIAKGLLATLELEHPSLWIRKYGRTPPEHLRILLEDVMEEIYTLETVLTQITF